MCTVDGKCLVASSSVSLRPEILINSRMVSVETVYNFLHQMALCVVVGSEGNVGSVSLTCWQKYTLFLHLPNIFVDQSEAGEETSNFPSNCTGKWYDIDLHIIQNILIIII